jgi:hypothetical protein
MQLLALSKLLARRTSSPSSSAGLDPVALVLDSVPDSNGLRCMVVVFTQTVRNPVKRLLAIPILAFFYSVFALTYGNPPVLKDLRQRLNSPLLMPQSPTSIKGLEENAAPERARGVPRLYFASRLDTMTRFAQVQSHMEAARRAGLDVRAEIFENSSHVSHAKEDPERYWNAIKGFWRDVGSAKAPKAKL